MSVTVTHSRGTYEIVFTDVRSVLGERGPGDCVVTDSNVQRALGLSTEAFVIEPGEQSKCLECYGRLQDWLASRANRSSCVVAIGGGVVGDLAGFAAATFMRGIGCVQVPTSLLAMVDSSVGGKVGIDLKTGKNLVGAFWPPLEVRIPLDALKTLPAKEFTNGMAEVCKYALIKDAALYRTLLPDRINPEDSQVQSIIESCIEIKRKIVEEDEFERSGTRAALNFGHTIGHAIEKCAGYQGVLHGEAVAVGMVVESLLAERLGVARKGLAGEVASLLQTQGLSTRPPTEISLTTILDAAAFDKKSGPQGLGFSLVTEVGECKLLTGLDRTTVESALLDVWV